MSNQPQKIEFLKVRETTAYSFVLGVALSPSVDYQDDQVADPEFEIEKAAHDYMERSRTLGEMHERKMDGAVVVESFIARDDLRINGVVVPKHSWVLGVRIYDHEVRKRVRNGTYRGFSIGGKGEVQQVDDDE